jgi:DNA-binding PucR family transcriptional regulator
VTIGDLISEKSLGIEAAYLTEEAKNTPVSWVHATEQIDPRPHLRRSELVCTLGSALVEPLAAKRFVEAVADASVAGVALGLGEVHLEPPQSLVDACKESLVPLLLLAHGIPFLAVNDVVLKKRSQRENEARRKEINLLSRLLGMARSGAPEEELLEVAGDTLGGILRLPQAHETPPFTWRGEATKPTAEFLDQLGSLLEFSKREQVRVSVEKQQQLGQLLDLVSKGLAHPAAILPELEIRGLDRSNIRVSCWPRGSENALQELWPNALISVAGQETIVISGAESVEAIHSQGLVCGYSSIISLTELRRALNEGRSALRLARSKGGVAGPEQLVSMEALLEQLTAEQLAPFIEQLLAPIVSADEKSRGDLLLTLTTFLDLDRQLQATAVTLSVHVNTIRNRLSRIRNLSGRDPYTMSGSVDLGIALWAAEHQKRINYRLIRPLG